MLFVNKNGVLEIAWYSVDVAPLPSKQMYDRFVWLCGAVILNYSESGCINLVKSKFLTCHEVVEDIEDVCFIIVGKISSSDNKETEFAASH